MADNRVMTIPKFRDPLPEDRLSEREREERIRVLDQFSKKLKKERKAAGFDDRIAIRQLLLYVGKRLDLLDLENRHGRVLAQFDSLLCRTAKPVPQGLLGVAADAFLDFGLKDRERMIQRHEKDINPLIAEISSMAPDVNGLLDQRPNPDKENHVLRPSSCLPEKPIMDEDAPSKSGSANGKNQGSNPTLKPRKKGVWLDPENTKIVVDDKTYWRNCMANRIMQMKGLTERQCDAAVLLHGYQMGDENRSQMSDTDIGTLMSCSRRTVYGHLIEAESRMRQLPVMRDLLISHKRKIKRSEDDKD